jgi:hypothetical protein
MRAQSIKGVAVVTRRSRDADRTPCETSKQVQQDMTGTITQLHRDRGVGTLLGEDAKHYMFRRNDMSEGWFHDLKEGATVAFLPDKNLAATRVRPLRASSA